MPTKKKVTQKQKQKQSQVVNITIGDKGGKRKARPRVLRQLPKQPIIVNVSTPQMSMPSFETRTFLDGSKFSSLNPPNELAPPISSEVVRTAVNEFTPTPIIDTDNVRQKRMENLKKFIDKLPDKLPEKVPEKVPSIPSSFSSISIPPPSPFTYIDSYTPISPISPVSSIYDNLYDSYPNSPFITNANPVIEQQKEEIERKKMSMEEQMTKIRDRLIKEEKERNFMGMEDLNSRLQNDMFNEDKQRSLMDKEDINVNKKSVMPPRRSYKEIRESYNMGLEDPTTPKKTLSKLNKIELQQLAQQMGIGLTNYDGYQREKKELQDMIRQIISKSK